MLIIRGDEKVIYVVPEPTAVAVRRGILEYDARIWSRIYLDTGDCLDQGCHFFNEVGKTCLFLACRINNHQYT